MNSTQKIREIPYCEYLDKQGHPLKDPSQEANSLPEIANDIGTLQHYYRHMVLTRMLDQKIIALQRTGLVGTYPSCLGQEAIGTAVGSLLHKEDIFVPYYRDQAAQLARGVSIKELLLYWGGDERGSDFEQCREDLPVCVPIATQLTQAAGVASAIKIRKQSRAVIASCGDGATSRGDFYEAINLAGVWQLPLVIIVTNNRWAISVPLEIQTAAETIAHKAFAAGIPSERVDGNDIIAMHDVVERALKRAYTHKGPTLIEAITYRLSDHTTADDASRYRNHNEVKSHWAGEPIKRLRLYLQHHDAWSDADEQAWQAQCQTRIEGAVESYLNTPREKPEAFIDHLYASLPTELIEQREHLIAKGARL